MVDQGTNGRPHSSNWRALHAEGILWDGQIYVAGAGVELPLRLIATSQRVAFAKGGAFVLDVSRDWLEPAPFLNSDGTITLTIDANEGERPERLRLVVRDGRRLAVDLVAALNSAKPVIQSKSGTIYIPEPLADVPEPPMARGRRSTPPARIRERSGVEPIAALDSDDFPPVVEAPSRSRVITIDDDLPPATLDQSTGSDLMQVGRDNGWPLQPISSMSNRTSRHARRSWAIRLSGLVLLLVLAAGIGSGRMPSLPGKEIASHLPATSIDAPFTDADPTQTPEVKTAQETAPTSTSASVALVQPTTPPSETAIALGVGGMDDVTEIPLTPTEKPTETAQPTATATPTPTDKPVVKAAEEPEPTATEEPVIVVQEPEATETPEPTIEPTATATIPPTATEEPVVPTDTPVPTIESTATSEPVPTLAPTDVPTSTSTNTVTSTSVPSATPTETATATPSPTPTELPDFPAQDRTLDSGELPLQTFSDSGFRFTVEGVSRGATIEDVALTEVSGAEWVLVLINAENWSNTAESLAIAEFELLTYGDFGVAGASPDAVTGVIAKTMGLNPALGANDTALFSPDDAHRIALVYLIRPDTTLMQLTYGDNTIDLGPSQGQPLNPLSLGDAPVAPELMEVKVIQVLDGQSILVEAENGGRARVRYLGVAAPLSDICYSAESKAANEALVGGKTVFLERENENRVPGSRIVRDVWIESSDGGLTLVAAELAAVGSVVAQPTEPDIRFSGWIQAAADGAQANNLGLWAACGGLQTPTPEPTVEVDAFGSPVAGVTVEADVTVDALTGSTQTESDVQPASLPTETPAVTVNDNLQIIEQASSKTSLD